MSCLIPLLEDQIELLRKQVTNAAYSHDALFAKVGALEAENAALREKLDPQPPMMTEATGSERKEVDDEADKKL